MSQAERLSPGLLAELACILEVSARKPGNVTPLDGFEDACHLDFLLAAAAAGRALEGTHQKGVGRAVLDAVEGSRAVAAGNLNLGLILLLAPLAGAAGAASGPVTRAAVARLLAGLTAEDAELVYRAIRLASPGGLGSAAAEDVLAGPPVKPLVAAMALAAERDLVARQYSGGFREAFEEGVPALKEGLDRRLPLEAAIIHCHLRFMAAHPDSLIGRKSGEAAARESSRRAQAVLELGWPGPRAAEAALRDLDRWLRSDGRRRNPGTSADLVGASLFLAISNGIIPFPLRSGDWPWKSTGCG